MTTATLPTYFVSHGGGPWPYMDGPFRRNFDELERSLVRMRTELGEAPRAVLVVSGHWEAPAFTVSSGERPGMVYDYHGFPEHLYHITYPAPGSPSLAADVQEFLAAAELSTASDALRGFDHGTFSVMKSIYPDADMPVVQLSLQADLDPALHLAAGRALAPLRDMGVVIVGSGLSYHNLREMHGTAGHEPSRRFDAWLRETLIDVAPIEREQRLTRWEEAPAARSAHPRADHLLPLMVAVGAAGEAAGALSYHQTDFAGGLTASSFRFGRAPGPTAAPDELS